jgi:hypothetical protein
VGDAENKLLDIERRLERRELADRQPFDTPLEELKRKLALAKCRVS